MTSIFVAKLDFGVSQEELKSVFERFGRVNKVTIATDRETGKPRGFAFVEMFDESEADTAIQNLDNSTINGRQIAVKKAEDRSNARPDNRSENRGEFKPRKDFSSDRGERKPFERPASTYNKVTKDSDDDAISPIAPIIEIDKLKSEARKKELPKKKEVDKKISDGKPRQQKMEAYKKSGKNNRFFDIDDDDDY
ncbi:MAG: RNA recognition motif domain-containing protein [Flavobacteriia bacterium]